MGHYRANCDGCGNKWDNKSTAPVGSFAANPFQIWDSVGNAWEWVEDCWHEAYDAAPADGSAWTVGECPSRVIRGGSWNDVPRDARAGNRSMHTAITRNSFLGFRLARTL